MVVEQNEIGNCINIEQNEIRIVIDVGYMFANEIYIDIGTTGSIQILHNELYAYQDIYLCVVVLDVYNESARCLLPISIHCLNDTGRVACGCLNCVGKIPFSYGRTIYRCCSVVVVDVYNESAICLLPILIQCLNGTGRVACGCPHCVGKMPFSHTRTYCRRRSTSAAGIGKMSCRCRFVCWEMC